MIDVGIVGVGTYLPEKTMKAAEIAGLTNGVWSEDAVINKLGIKQRYLPGPDDGTQEMGAKAALKCLENTGVDPKEIDVILCIGEEWKEYPLTTSACYIQDRIGATNAWGIDVQNRCCTCVSAMKIAADMLRADDEINTIMICGGYRNGDFVDFTDKNMSMMYNLSAGGGAIIYSLQSLLSVFRKYFTRFLPTGSILREVRTAARLPYRFFRNGLDSVRRRQKERCLSYWLL